MILVHMDSGLGNQMLDYAEFLAIQLSNPDKKCILETIIYDISGQENMTSMWNGYELESVFGIKVPNLKNEVTSDMYTRIMNKLLSSKFWTKGWDYTPYTLEALADEGIRLANYGKAPVKDMSQSKSIKDRMRYGLTQFFTTSVGYSIKRYLRSMLSRRVIKQYYDSHYDLYREYPDNSYVGHSLNFRYKGFGIEKVEDEIKRSFKFPNIDADDVKNREIAEIITNCNSVAIHARRGDLLTVNGHCYEHGYFKRAVNYIKKQVKDPVFIFFTDEGSMAWSKANADIFGLNFATDKVHFVTWNKGEHSYRDMQLMSMCKHNIFTESSFGFWGAYLNDNPNKITCAPDVKIIATNHF